MINKYGSFYFTIEENGTVIANGCVFKNFDTFMSVKRYKIHLPHQSSLHWLDSYHMMSFNNKQEKEEYQTKIYNMFGQED